MNEVLKLLKESKDYISNVNGNSTIYVHKIKDHILFVYHLMDNPGIDMYLSTKFNDCFRVCYDIETMQDYKDVSDLLDAQSIHLSKKAQYHRA